ncbi:MAG: T9SS type A sorting domain-containing protein [Tannerellaceae bacterium]|jgi:hypothetical protein|nr:T9SS type A sorting domain-containing protein [Tannerellaceae bacterium]
MKTGLFIVIAFVLWLVYSPPVYGQQAKTARHIENKQPEKPVVEITASENRIKVTNAPAGSKLEVYSVVGIKVKEIEMKHASGEYTVDIAKGYYIVRIGEVVRKVAIR